LNFTDSGFIYNSVTITEGITTGVAAANDVDTNAAAIVNALNADTTFKQSYVASYDSAAKKLTVTALKAEVDANAANMAGSGKVTGTCTLTSKNATAAVTGKAAGTDKELYLYNSDNKLVGTITLGTASNDSLTAADTTITLSASQFNKEATKTGTDGLEQKKHRLYPGNSWQDRR